MFMLNKSRPWLSLIAHLHETCLCWARAACSKPCCSHLRPSTPCCVRKGPDGPRAAGPDSTRASAGFACSCRTSRTQTRTADRPPEPAEGPASSLYKPARASKTHRSWEHHQLTASVYKIHLYFPSIKVTTILFQRIMTEEGFREECKQVYLNSIFQGSGQQKESRRMLETLLSEQRESVLQCCLPPAVFTEVIAEERRHLHVMLWPSTHRSS